MRKDLAVLPLVLPYLAHHQVVQPLVLGLAGSAAPDTLVQHLHLLLHLLLATLETALLELERNRVAAAACCARVRHLYPNAGVPCGTSCCLACAGWAPQRFPA